MLRRECSSCARRDSAHNSPLGRRFVLQVCAATLVFLGTEAAAAPVKEQANNNWTLVPLNGSRDLPELVNKTGKAETKFSFHPEKIKDTSFSKIDFDPFNGFQTTHTYGAGEIHGTTGEAKHHLSYIRRPARGGYDIADSVSAETNSGRAEPPQQIDIQARLRDPFVFSDISPDASFPFDPDGMQISVSLDEGTAFPDLFATYPGGPGAIADDTRMTMRLRVAPGAIADPDLFWSDGLPGAIDIFSLTIKSDPNFLVDATLTPGASTSYFSLDLSGLAGAEAAIENAFDGTGGKLQTSMGYFMSASFVPQSGVSQYTVGMATGIDVAAYEPGAVPEPASWLVFALTALVCGFSFIYLPKGCLLRLLGEVASQPS